MADDIGHPFGHQHAHAARASVAGVRPLAQAAASLRVAAQDPAAALRAAPSEAESPGQRAIALMKLAKATGEEHVTVFLQTLELSVRQAREIVDGKEVYPAGVRDICSKLTEYSANRAQAIFSIMTAENAPGGASASLVLEEPATRSLEESDLAAEMEALPQRRGL